jgi:hypothetical protein
MDYAGRPMHYIKANNIYLIWGLFNDVASISGYIAWHDSITVDNELRRTRKEGVVA